MIDANIDSPRSGTCGLETCPTGNAGHKNTISKRIQPRDLRMN